MLTLLYKDFKLIFASGKVGKWRVLSYLINALLIALFITIETVVVAGVLTRLKSYTNAPLAFLAIALFVVSVLMIFVCLTQAKKLFFNEKDASNLSMMPVSNRQIILSKLVFLFILQYVTGLMFTYPVIVSYAIIFNRGTSLYYWGMFYPLLAFPFECGVALILVYPYKLLGDFLKKHPLVQFIVAAVVIFGLCYLYSVVLNIFVSLIASNQSGSLFSTDNINAMVAARRFMIPVTWLVGIFFEGGARMIVVQLPVSLGVLILGIALSVVSYNHLRFLRFQAKSREKEFSFKTTSVTTALIKKEFTLLFKDSDNLFSFTGLLVVQPFLVYLIVSSMNTIFSSGAFSYYVALLPTFLPVMDMLLVILVSLVIAQGANNYITNEAKNIRFIKSIPVNVFKQLFIKVALPFLFVIASTLLTYIVLLALGIVSVETALVGFVMTLLIHVVFSVISLYEELKIRQNRARNYFLSSTFSYALPILYAAAMIVAAFFGLGVTEMYLIGLGVILVSGIPWVIGFKRRVLKLFDALEVVN